MALRARLKLAGKINHNHLFFRDDGSPIRDLNHPYDRWRWTLSMTLKARYREPYNARHSFVSWNLMLGKNLLWVAKQHGHSVQTMLDVYAAWIEGSQDADLEAIRRAMEASPRSAARTLRWRKALSELDTLVTPNTLMRWYRTLVAQKWTYAHHRGPGRPRTIQVIVQLIVRMALENRSWGYTRIQGALASLGHDVGRGRSRMYYVSTAWNLRPNEENRRRGRPFLRRTGSALRPRTSSL